MENGIESLSLYQNTTKIHGKWYREAVSVPKYMENGIERSDLYIKMPRNKPEMVSPRPNTYSSP
jgi:hypothetical protein